MNLFAAACARQQQRPDQPGPAHPYGRTAVPAPGPNARPGQQLDSSRSALDRAHRARASLDLRQRESHTRTSARVFTG